MGNSRNIQRTRKRKFLGNKHTKQDSPCRPESTSAKKICLQDQSLNTESDDFNLVINYSILKTLVEKVGTCPDCMSDVILNHEKDLRLGFHTS